MKPLVKFLATAGLSLLLAGSAFAQGKIATINFGKVFDNYWKTVQANVLLQDERDKYNKDLKDFSDQVDKAKQDWQKLIDSANDQAVSSAERDRRRAAADNKLKDINDLGQTIRMYQSSNGARLDTKYNRMREDIMKEVLDVIRARAKSSGYSLVLDTAAESRQLAPVVLYSDGANDMTDPVLQQLNATAPADLPKPAATNAPASGASASAKDNK